MFYAADKAEDLSWGHSLLDALRDCSKETKEKVGIYVTLVEAEYMQSSTYFFFLQKVSVSPGEQSSL